MKIIGTLKNEKNIAVFIGLISLVLFAYLYLPVFSIGFLSDDFLDINQRFSIQTLNSFEMGGFRPLSVAVYSIDSSIYGPTNSWGWHLTNLILHIGNIILMWFLLKELGFKEISRILTVSFFVLFAAGSPAVARMSGRTKMIAMLPLLGAFLCHARWCLHKKIFILSQVRYDCFYLSFPKKWLLQFHWYLQP